MFALFGKRGVVDDQDAGSRRDQFEEPAPDRIPVPGRVRDEMLKRLVVTGIGDAGQHRLHRLARTVAQQALQVPTQRHLLQPRTETTLELLDVLQQPTDTRPRALIEHRRSAYPTPAIRTMSSIQINSAK